MRTKTILLLCFHCVLYNLFVERTECSVDSDYLFNVKGCVQESSLEERGGKPVTNLQGATKDILGAIAVLNNTTVNTAPRNVLQQLNELSQYNNVKYDFILVGEEGPPHNKKFRVQLKIGNEVYEAEAGSKKSARQLTASYALERTNYRTPPLAKTDLENQNLNTPTVQLNNIAQKLALEVNYENVDKSSLRRNYGEHSYDGKPKSVLLKLNHTFDDELFDENQVDGPPFIYKVTVGDREYYGIGNTVQDAKHESAKNALDSMKQEALEEHNFCGNDGYEEECYLKKMSLKSPISKVHEIAQKLKIDVGFDIVKERGKDHNKVFVMQGKLGSILVTTEAKSKKEAKKSAAELILERINELPGIPKEDYSIILKTKSKKNKKKNKQNKIVQKLKSLSDSAANGLSAVWNYASDRSTKGVSNDVSEDKDGKTKSHIGVAPLNKESFKNNLLILTQAYNLGFEYKDLGKQDGHFYSKLSLATKPRYVCFGRGESLDVAQDLAALRGLRLLSKFGFNIKTVHSEGFHEYSKRLEDLDMVWVKAEPPAEEEKAS